MGKCGFAMQLERQIEPDEFTFIVSWEKPRRKQRHSRERPRLLKRKIRPDENMHTQAPRGIVRQNCLCARETAFLGLSAIIGDGRTRFHSCSENICLSQYCSSR